MNLTDFVECALCGSTGNCDFHHWDYQNERGCYLCRSCHQCIHEPEGARPSECRGDSWVQHALPRLVERHGEVNGQISPDEFMQQYNIPEEYRCFVPKTDTGIWTHRRR